MQRKTRTKIALRSLDTLKEGESESSAQSTSNASEDAGNSGESTPTETADGTIRGSNNDTALHEATIANPQSRTIDSTGGAVDGTARTLNLEGSTVTEDCFIDIQNLPSRNVQPRDIAMLDQVDPRWRGLLVEMGITEAQIEEYVDFIKDYEKMKADSVSKEDKQINGTRRDHAQLPTPSFNPRPNSPLAEPPRHDTMPGATTSQARAASSGGFANDKDWVNATEESSQCSTCHQGVKGKYLKAFGAKHHLSCFTCYVSPKTSARRL